MIEPPAPFQPHQRRSPVTDPWQPLFAHHTEAAVILGLHIAQAHCNGRGLLHGGVIAALADNAMGLSIAARTEPPSAPVTVSLHVDYFGQARIGSWVTFETVFVQVGGTLATASCMVMADATPVAKAGATFRLLRS